MMTRKTIQTLGTRFFLLFALGVSACWPSFRNTEEANSVVATHTPPQTTVQSTSTPSGAPLQTATPQETGRATPVGTKTPSAPVLLPTLTADPRTNGSVEAVLSEMTLEQKVGQLFALFVDGTEYNIELDGTIRDLHIGGVLIFEPNVSTPYALADLINTAQSTSRATAPGIPLFVGVDHEGGRVNRFGETLTRFPSNMALAATGSPDLAKAVASAMAAELQALGINMILGPVIDVNSDPYNPVIGTRAFSSDPELVAEYGVAMISAFQLADIVATAKHFPGHGDTTVDSHFALPVVNKELSALQDVDLLPFRKAVAAGVDAIMTAHIAVPSLSGDATLPATFSAAVLTDQLRGKMGYSGLIATDSLGMNAVDTLYGVPEAAAMAFSAGADLLMFGNDPGHNRAEQYAAYQEVLNLILSGNISTERLDASVRRILQIKADRGILDQQIARLDAISTTIRSEEHLALSQHVAEQSITLLRNNAQLLPLNRSQSLLLIYPSTLVNLPGLFQTYTPNVQSVAISVDPSAEEIERMDALADLADVVLVFTYDALFYPQQSVLVEALGDRPLVIVASESPYDLMAFPSVGTYVASYGSNMPSLLAATRLLFGDISPAGKLPVELPGLMKLGAGLDDF